VGVVLIAAAAIAYAKTRSFLADAVRTEGTVIALDIDRSSKGSATYRPIVRFAGPKGVVEFMSSVGNSPPVYKTGQTVSVLYRASAPDDARIGSFLELWFGAIVTGALGAIFSLISGRLIFLQATRARIKKHLLSYGMPIQADFQSVQINKSSSMSGRHPFCIITQWLNPATSRIHVFQSEDIWFDPTRYIKRKHITVLIDKENPKHYHVDVSFLPEIAD